MKTTMRAQADQEPRHAPLAQGIRRPRSGAERSDNRPDAIAQRQLAESIHVSPVMVAQRQQLGRIFGPMAQLKGLKDEELQMKAAPDVLQRQGPEEEDKLLQGKFTPIQLVEDKELLQGKFISRAKPIQVQSDRSMQENRTGMPDQLKSGIESLSGMSLDHVRVHYNSSQPAQLNALAYAQGTDIHVASGQEQHLPHEAWHVVQQAQGRVQPTMQMQDGVPVNDDQSLEHEADVMGAKAMGNAVRREGLAREERKQSNRLIQRMTQNDTSPTFQEGAQIDPAGTLVIRGGGIPYGINASTIESLNRNKGLKKGDGKKTPTWPTGTWTGISVVSCTEHVEGKKAMVVIKVPDGLEIVQCDNDHHAEFRTTKAMSTTDLNNAIKAIKATGTEDGSVAQLKDS